MLMCECTCECVRVCAPLSLTGHLNRNGTLMGALWEMVLASASMISVSSVPYVHGGSGLITSCECLRHTRKKIWQLWDEERQMPREEAKESIFSSKTPEERA